MYTCVEENTAYADTSSSDQATVCGAGQRTAAAEVETRQQNGGMHAALACLQSACAEARIQTDSPA